MIDISQVTHIGDLRSATLRSRAERGHCARSKEFVASLDGEEAGFLSYEDRSDEEVGFIYEIFVLHRFRRKGVGASLMSFAENYALNLGCKSVRLKPYSLDRDQVQGQLTAWYESLGYGRAQDDQEFMEKWL